MDKVKPLEWLLANLDGMGLAFFAALSTAIITAHLRGRRGVVVLLGLLSAFMLTGMSVPVAAIYWGLHWVWWPAIGGAIGLTSLSIMWFAIRFADRLQDRAPDFADGLGKRLVPEAPDARPATPPAAGGQ